MARFDTSGLDDLMRQLSKLGSNLDAATDEMLMSAAAVVRDEWKKSADRHNLRDSGDMIASIGYPRKPTKAGDVKSIDIYPQGKDHKGVRNAEKGFILNFGTKTRPATHWIDEADQASAQPVQEVMEQIFDKYLRKGENQ